MIIEQSLSRIEQLFYNCQEQLNKEQQIPLIYQIQGYNEKKVKDKIIIEASLCDNNFTTIALFIEDAATLLKTSSEHYQNIDLMIIQLLKWKMTKLQKNQAFFIVITKFSYYGYAQNPALGIQYNPENIQNQKKVKLTIQRNNKNYVKNTVQIDQQNDHMNILNQGNLDYSTKKKVKIEALKSTQDSFNLDYSLLNCSLPENPSTIINRSIMQFNKQQQQQQQQVQIQEYTKISAMFPNMSKWILEGRIILKTELQEFKCKRTGQVQKYFKILILDCEQETITGLFYEKAIPKFFEKLEQSKVYTFKNASISQDKTDGSKKITFNEFSIIQESNNIVIPTNPQIQPSTLKEIQESTLLGPFDIVVVIQELKADTQNCKTVIVLDQTAKILIKFWGDQYKNIEFKKGEIMIFKGLQTHTYGNQKQLYSGYQTIILKNDALAEDVKGLKAWLVGKNIDTIYKPQQDTSNLDIQQFEEVVLKQLSEGNIQQTYYNYVCAYIMEIEERNIMYASCPNSRCLSKMEYLENRKTYKCKKCFIENDNPKYRYILKARVMDSTGNITATFFDENAQKLLQKSADEFRQLPQIDQHQRLIIAGFRQKKLKLSAKFREFQGYVQPQYNVDEIEDIDYKALANTEIKRFEEFDYLLNISYLL